jgi:hypothetical protein
VKYSINKTLVYFLIFTVIGSFLAYKLVVKGWDVTYESYYAEAMAQE